MGTPCWASQETQETIAGSDFGTEAFQVLSEGELVIKRVSNVTWILGVANGTVDGDRKLTAGFPIIQVERSACNFGRAQPEPPCR